MLPNPPLAFLMARPIPGMIAAVMVAGTLGLGGVPAMAQAPSPRSESPATKPPFSGEAVATETQRAPTDQLSTKRYSNRQQATMEMWRRRDLSRDEVQQAARHPDPEVAGRAKWILRQWRRGALPDVPPEISRLLQRSDDATIVQELLDAGQFAATVVAVEESAGTVDRESIQRRISALLTRRFPVYIKAAVDNDSLLDLWKLIDLTADSKEMAVCRVQLMLQMGMEVQDEGVLPSSAETWSRHDRDRAQALVLIVLGRHDEALQIAVDSGDERLLSVCEMLAGRWPEMADRCQSLAIEAEPGSYEQTRLWCQTLIASDRADRDDLFREAAEQLATIDSSASKLATELRWKCLAGHGRVDDALTILSKARPDAAAVVAIAASRGDRAFEILGFPLADVDQGRRLENWVEEALATQVGQDNPTDAIRGALGMMRCLLSIGRQDAAWDIATQMCDSEVTVGEIPLREYVMSTLTMTFRRDWVLRLAQRAGKEAFSPVTQATLASSLGTADRATVLVLFDAVERLEPERDFDRHLSLVCDLLLGDDEAPFGRSVDYDRLFDLLITAKPGVDQRRGVIVPAQPISLEIARMFSQNGRADLGTRCLQALIERGDVEAAFESAEQELDGGNADLAAKRFGEVWQRIEGGGTSRRYRRVSDDVDWTAKALVGQWTLARRMGDLSSSERLQRQLELTLCSPSAKMRNALASYLGDRDETDMAVAAFNVLLPMTAFGTPDATGLYQVAWKFSRLTRDIDIDQAARWYDLAAAGTLESTDFRSVAYVTLPIDVRRWTLEAAIGRGDRSRVASDLRRIAEIDPLDIDSAERLLPAMRERGMGELADATLNKIVDRGMEYLKSYPFDATSCNNLAWVAAMNRMRLRDALTLSEKAVFLEPDSAVFRDTLAEVLFLLGRKKEALQVEESCVLDDPSQWHLHQQIEKYRQALKQPLP